MADEGDAGLGPADLVAAFSLATDLGLGQPTEHVLRSWLLAARLGERIGASVAEQTSLFYTAMLAWVGCLVDTREVARWFGDDIAYRSDSYEVDLAGLPMIGFLLRHAGAGGAVLHRVRLGATILATGGRAVERSIMSHCIATGHFADRLGLGPEVARPLQQVFTRWDGKGVPGGVGGNDIALPVRLFQLAEVVEVFYRTGGVDAAVAVAGERRGKAFDPALVDEFRRHAAELLCELDGEPDWLALVEKEPALQARLDQDGLDAALEAFADFSDVRSPFRAGHSRGVAELTAAAGRQARLPEEDVVAARRAALVHDLGLSGVPSTVLDKPGPLTASEFERVRLHAYYTERMLARHPALAPLGAIAGAHHERADGSGYHRGLVTVGIPVAGRLLAAADAFHAMTEPRPHRPALSAAEAASALRDEVRAGRLAAEAVDAVLAAAGEARGKRRVGPSGLTAREVEVLVLIARGASNRQVAKSLGISVKTAGTHIERIYSKIGASTRAAATLFAMQHGLLDTLAPLDGRV